jgi:hypothetical protein
MDPSPTNIKCVIGLLCFLLAGFFGRGRSGHHSGSRFMPTSEIPGPGAVYAGLSRHVRSEMEPPVRKYAGDPKTRKRKSIRGLGVLDHSIRQNATRKDDRKTASDRERKLTFVRAKSVSITLRLSIRSGLTPTVNTDVAVGT